MYSPLPLGSYLLAAMPYFRNFIYHIDKRRWKYHFLMVSLCMGVVEELIG